MKTINDCTHTGLQWTQPQGARRYWELVSDGEIVATLDFPRIFDTLAELRTADGAWQMRRKGVFNMDVLVFEPNNPEPVAVYYPRWTSRRGTLVMAQGHEYSFEVTDFWANRYEIRDAVTGMVLLRYRRGLERARFRDLFKMQTTMDVVSRILTGPDLALLSGLGQYLIELLQEQSAAAVSASTAATS